MDLLIIHILLCGLFGALGNPVRTDCLITISTANWTVSGSCRMEQNVSSNYNYSCQWELDNGLTTFGQFDSGGELCSFTQPLALTEDTYYYRVHFLPPTSAAAFLGEVKIAQPGNSAVSRLQVVKCGENLTCSCPTTTADSERLVKTNLHQEDNRTQFTCHVTWAGSLYRSITYSLIAIYTKGPDGVIITGPRDLIGNASHIIELVCSTTARVYPGVTFTWTQGVCENVTHNVNFSTCSFPNDVILDQKRITCTAINNNNSGISVSTSVILRTKDIRSIPLTTSSIQTYVGIVVAVLAFIGIAIFLGVFFKRRYNDSRNTADQPPDLRGTEHTYTSTSRQHSRHTYSTLRHTDTTYEVPLPPAQHTRSPSSPASTTASPRENTEYADMELLPTEITYEAPIPPTQDVHTYMALHDIHSATTASFKGLNVFGDD